MTPPESIRTGMSAGDFGAAFRENLRCAQGRSERGATRHDLYSALALTVRDRLLDRAVESIETYGGSGARRVAYLSAEYLPGPHLGNNLLNLGMTEKARAALAQLGHDLDELLAEEEEPGLGNGGLGRLASCYMDSMATVGVPAIGYGIRYEFGIFEQTIHDGWQQEKTDKWLARGNPWEIPRPSIAFSVKFGGRTETSVEANGHQRVVWIPDSEINGVAYDTPIQGYESKTCNLLRLWTAQAVDSFDFATFNHGDYYRAVEEKVASETITKILYPNDEARQGKELRLKQQALFTSCSLQDMLRIHALLGGKPTDFHTKWAVQLNDTHPALAVAELMRLLVDHHDLAWDDAWKVCRQTFAYTNHTLLPEALERWPIDLFGQLLPRHLEIVFEINRRFLDEVRAAFPGDDSRLARLSLIDESGGRFVRMAHLACVGSHRINGVAELHSRLLRETVLRDFAEMWPERFCNVTNGVTPRRFVALSNPSLSDLISEQCGDAWLHDLSKLRALEQVADDPAFQAQWRAVKLKNKWRLGNLVAERTGLSIDPEALLEVQAKRIHEYKRQHLSVLHILALYLRLQRDPQAPVPARVFLFGGKAAPGYFMAKRIIKLINAVANLVSHSPATRERLKVIFFPNFNVKFAQFVYPAADLSAQISTAGKEASGTGNMKFALNGALTIGTLDGANVEIREEVGAENFFLFGLDASQVVERRQQGYRPRDYYDSNPELREALDFLAADPLTGGDRELFAPILADLLDHDPYFVLADFAPFLEAQAKVSALWRQPGAWTRSSILNTARMGKFSSDRSIRDYCANIWNISPMRR